MICIFQNWGKLLCENHSFSTFLLPIEFLLLHGLLCFVKIPNFHCHLLTETKIPSCSGKPKYLFCIRHQRYVHNVFKYAIHPPLLVVFEVCPCPGLFAQFALGICPICPGHFQVLKILFLGKCFCNTSKSFTSI